MTVNEIFEALAADSSRLAKEAILRQHIGNEDLKGAIKLALDTSISFHIRKIPEYDVAEESFPLYMQMAALAPLINRDVTGHAAIEHLRSILRSCQNDDDKVIIRIINKDLKCGVQASTANKIWPGLVFEWPCMLASQSDAKLLSKFEFPAFYDLKYDGMRFNAVVIDHQVTFKSRAGQDIDLLGAMEYEFDELSGGKNVVYDGELWVADENGNPLPRKIGNGMLQKGIKGTMTKEIAARVRCSIWDRIPYSAFRAGIDKTPYHERREALIQDFQRGPKTMEYNYTLINEGDTSLVYDMNQVNILFLDQLEDDQEGGILKSFDAPWEDKRSKHQIKFKAEKDADLLCTGWYYGKPGSKYAAFIGGLTLQSSDGVITTNCGSGLDDEARKKDPSEYVGKIIAITYNARINDKDTGKESLFLPIFQEVRLDKTEADSSETIK